VILLDANVIVRFLIGAVEPGSERGAELARDLFERAEQGEFVLTTTETAMHETAYVLTSKQIYGVPSEIVADQLAQVVKLPCMHLKRDVRKRLLDAIDLWKRHRVLGLADALLATLAMDEGYELASFDRHFDRIDGLRRWTSEI
jgi:predicted nucleic acid-binding protein